MKQVNILFGIAFLFMSLILASCNKGDKVQDCNVADPDEELGWLKASIEEIEQQGIESAQYAYYMTAEYKGETVFYYGSCDPLANYVLFVVNCTGDTLGRLSELYDELSDIRVLWKHEESLCAFTE